MAGDSDGGIDKRAVLAAILHPAPVAIPTTVPPPAAARPPSAVRRAVVPPPPWVTHRNEISAIVSAFVALVWISVGVAAGEGMAILLGLAFGVGALGIWLLDLWNSD
jgi:hypothetical protein